MTLVRIPLLLLLAAFALLVSPLAAQTLEFSDDVYDEPQFFYDGDSHVEFGRQLGETFASQIRARLQATAKLQTLLLPYYATPDGKALYQQYLDVHIATFPDYVDELRGIADGSGVPFETIFLMNLVEEFEDSIPTTFRSLVARRHTLRCSDIVLTAPTFQAVVHNEDGSAADVNRTAIVTARIGAAPKFVAFTYVGDLPSGAFGANANGVAFTLNFVQPAETRVGGLGRGFVSRDLLSASNATDALARITRRGQATGHNFQLMDVRQQRVWNVEVASFERHVVHEFVGNNASATDGQPTVSYHANQYQRLAIAQPPYASSLHRLQRFRELARPTNVREALAVLGDQHDRAWPVFHDAHSHLRGDRSGWTLATVAFDVRARRAVTFRGNPRALRVKSVWDLDTLRVTPDATVD